MRLPVIKVTVRDGKLVFRCEGCGRQHKHADLGDGVYLPQCPPGTAYRRTGYFLLGPRRKKPR